jgi:hypothetical protein
LVSGFVLSTWKSNYSPTFPEDVFVLSLDDPGPNKQIGALYDSNEFRQAYGCLAGIQAAINHFNPDYIVKVRSDQFVDLPSMIEHMQVVDNRSSIYKSIGQSGYLFFPNMLSFSP